MNSRVQIALGCILMTATLAAGQGLNAGNSIRAALDLQQKGNYAKAEREFQSALEACEGPACPQRPIILNCLGNLYFETGRFHDAEVPLRQAIDLLSPPAGAEHGLLALTLGNLAVVYDAEGRLSDAGSLYDRALSLKVDAHEGEVAQRLASMAWLAMAQDTRDMARAESLAQRALDLFARTQALETAGGAVALGTLARILEAQGKLAEAHDALEKALMIREKLFGPKDILVADSMDRLAMNYVHQGRAVEAEPLLKQAVTILRMNPPSSELATALDHWGQDLAEQGRWKEAETRIREGISTRESLLGADNPGVVAGLTDLAVFLQSRRRYDEASAVMKRVQTIDESNFSPNHPRIGMDLNVAGALATARKRYPEAEELLLHALAILQNSLPPGRPETGEVLLNLAEVYRLQNKLDQSRETYQRGLAVVRSAWGPKDLRLPRWLDAYATVLRAQQNFAEAAKIETQATGIRVAGLLHRPD